MPKRKFTEEEARERKNARQREYAKRTGYQSQKKNLRDNYTRIIIAIKKDKAERFKQKCKEENIPYSQILMKAIDDYLGDYINDD
jgi:predicted DNA binding CopG/RHH family protein